MTGSPDPQTRAERIAESVKEQFEEIDSSRRGFLGRSAMVGGTLLALGSGAGTVLAQEDDDETAAACEVAEFDDVEGTDLDILNYALTLEHLESALYEEAVDEFDEDDFSDSGVLSAIGEGLGSEVYAFVQTIAEQEEVHIEVLTEAVEILGGTPEEADSYDFGLDSVEDFLEVAQEIENLAVGGLAGAAPYVESPDLLATLLSIHSVEARHAALLNTLNGDFPFPNAFDAPNTQQEVLDAIDEYADGDDDETEADEDEDEEDEDDEVTETEAENETDPETETETPEAANETDTEVGNETDETTPFGEENETAGVDGTTGTNETGANATGTDTAGTNATGTETTGTNATGTNETGANETTSVFGNGSE